MLLVDAQDNESKPIYGVHVDSGEDKSLPLPEEKACLFIKYGSPIRIWSHHSFAFLFYKRITHAHLFSERGGTNPFSSEVPFWHGAIAIS